MPKILVVDDDPDIVEAISMFLRKEGHEIETASNRTEGMQAVETFQPDLLVLDCMMEEADDGMAMAQDLRRDGFGGKILMLSNISTVTGMDYDKDEDVVPVDDFQQKPVDAGTLVDKVNTLLSVEGRSQC